MSQKWQNGRITAHNNHIKLTQCNDVRNHLLMTLGVPTKILNEGKNRIAYFNPFKYYILHSK